jgi:hypothetical protein
MVKNKIYGGIETKEIGRGDMDWIPLGQDRVQCLALVKTVMNIGP